MAKHGEFFPENPRNVDELIDVLAQRAAAAQRMLNSMTAEQRAELMELSQQAFGDSAAGQQLGRAGRPAAGDAPGGGLGPSGRFRGENPSGSARVPGR